VRQHARPTEASAFDNLVKTAQRAIDNNSGDFESHLDDLRGRNFMILWRQDWFVIERFKWLARTPTSSPMRESTLSWWPLEPRR
jgi:molecular chaperone DnaK